MLVHAETAHGRSAGACRLDRRDGLVVSQIPELDLAVPGPGDELAYTTTLHVDVGDPLLVIAPSLHERRARVLSLVEDAYDSVAEPGDEDLAGYLVGCQARNAGARPGGDIVGADLRGCVPDFDDFDVASYKSFSLALLPVEDQACILVRWNQFGQCSKSGHNFDFGGILVVAEDLDDAVGGANHEKSLVVFIDEARLVDFAAARVAIGETRESDITLEVPYTVETVSDFT